LATVGESFYAAKARADPRWRRRQIVQARAREIRRQAADPEVFRKAKRDTMRRTRERQRQTGLTFSELLERSPIGDPELLRLVLNSEVSIGRVVYRASTETYALNGGLPDDVKQALRDL
jgi:hypothetical protein